MRGWVGMLVAGLLLGPGGAMAQDLFAFDEVEPVVTPSPTSAVTFSVRIGNNDWHKVRQVLDLAVSPTAPVVAALVVLDDGEQAILHWPIGRNDQWSYNGLLPRDIPLSRLIWHPKGNGLFALGERAIYSLGADWTPSLLWRSDAPLDGLVIGPRPFSPGFRLFFGQRQPSGTHRIASVDEKGRGYYLVTSEAPPVVPERDRETAPFTEGIADALPAAFHPAGDSLLISDREGCVSRKPYHADNWGKAERFKEPCGGAIAYAPNGVALLRWRADQAGVELVDLATGTRRRELTGLRFLTEPRFTADGRGLVGVVREAGDLVLSYQPLSLPLADVTNAWQFLEAPADQRRFAEAGGLFRPIALEQLYQLYDTESYTCGSYDYRTDVRPYLVTTDIFWEVYAAAFQGMFMAVERERAMPAFRSMVASAARELATLAPGSALAGHFRAAEAILTGHADQDEEARRVVADPAFAARGFYTGDAASAAYFMAARYLSSLSLKPEETALVRRLSETVGRAAKVWIGTYDPFIARSRRDLAWDAGRPVAPYVLAKPDDAALFPLSWGWDNEVFDRGEHHMDRPLVGPKGPRMLPTGLDLALVFGNPLAGSLLAALGQFQAFPDLEGRLKRLAAEFRAGTGGDGDSLYNRWLRALAVQWAEPPSAPVAGPLWQAKRLQTGLASWATLRHGTVLVNEVAPAECGEAGFESIVMRPPRGYVEPDPASFRAIAALFDAAAAMMARLWEKPTPLSEGLTRRLAETRDSIRRFAVIADKELAGEPLSPMDYADIHFVGRVAEHDFLIYQSLNADANALIHPDPVPKVVEVAGGRDTGYLLAAVGAPLEWDLIAPAFGRREIVKGAVYAYHEFTAPEPITDESWRQRVGTEPHPAWMRKFLSDKTLSCPPVRP